MLESTRVLRFTRMLVSLRVLEAQASTRGPRRCWGHREELKAQEAAGDSARC